MVRIKGGITTRRKHKKVLELAKGYWMTRHKQFKKAKEAVLHAGEYAFAGRKQKKQEFKTLWNIRINAAVRAYGMTYSGFMHALKVKKVALDRKILSEMALTYPKVFAKLVEKVK